MNTDLDGWTQIQRRAWLRHFPYRESRAPGDALSVASSYRTASGSERPADGRSVPSTSVGPQGQSAISGIVRGTLATARGSKNGARRSVLPGSAHSPFFEPRAVASVPRTVDRFRPLPSFRNDESAISGTVRRPLATARGTDPPSAECTIQIASGMSPCMPWQDQYRERQRAGRIGGAIRRWSSALASYRAAVSFGERLTDG